jgi:hypothetical protein
MACLYFARKLPAQGFAPIFLADSRESERSSQAAKLSRAFFACIVFWTIETRFAEVRTVPLAAILPAAETNSLV